MHAKGSREIEGSREKGFNEGLSLSALLDSLRVSPAWDEIARHHKLVDVSSFRLTPQSSDVRTDKAAPRADKSLLTAAVCWDFDPVMFPANERDKLLPLVSDPTAPLWALETRERQRQIRSAGSLSALRAARKTRKVRSKAKPGRAAPDAVGQRVIDRILKGPPYSLGRVRDEELPYWLQAVRWFADVVPELPTPAEVNRTLERRRVRNRLLVVAGPGFKGRVRELALMREWYYSGEPGPLVISGIGGVGKSALVAQFALSLPVDTVLLWLDFDRADLSPDDAESVLTLLSEQTTVQLEKFSAPDVDATEWAKTADVLGEALAEPHTAVRQPLLVLDGFEVAQHAKEHHKIWELLERILAKAPGVRVVVSGRAAVRSLKLGGREADSLPLKGMAAPDAEAWLRGHGIEDDKVVGRVVEISKGVPLVLKLALRWVDAGGKVSDLPAKLPEELVEGFLYQRILDRVIDPRMQPVARDALVLRRLTPELVAAVLADTIPEGLDAPGVFALLTREMGLVEPDEDAAASVVMLGGVPGMLSLRPEVRSATLRLLEIENAARVREIDSRAAKWYAKENLKEAANAAELVYHRLRLGDIKGAEAVWVDECAYPLRYAAEDLPETAQAERAWLLARTGDASNQTASLETWEKEAAGRIRSAIGRGLLRAVPEVLGERADRSAASPLVLYDAWARWQDKDVAGARALLASAGEAEGSVGRDRAVLGALLAALDGDRPAADALLAGIEDEARWAERPNGALEALAVRAARVRLTVDLPTEVELADAVRNTPDHTPLLDVLNEFLTASDVMLPELGRRVGAQWVEESLNASLPVPKDAEELKFFAERVHEERRTATFAQTPIPLPPVGDTKEVPPDCPWQAADLRFPADPSLPAEFKREVELGLDLFILGWRRWHLATSSQFLSQACTQAASNPERSDILSLSIGATLAAFRGRQMYFSAPSAFFPSLDHVLASVLLASQKAIVPIPSGERFNLAMRMLHPEAEGTAPDSMFITMLSAFQKLSEAFDAGAHNPLSGGGVSLQSFLTGDLLDKTHYAGLRSVLLYLLGPDPLEILCRHMLGLPDNLKP